MTYVLALPLLALFPAGAILAAVFDLRSYTIPNWLTGGLALAFVPAGFAVGLPAEAIGVGLATGAAVLAVCFGLFSLGWFGGGDAKLAAAMACWMGLDLLLPFVLATSILGGALALLIVVFRACPVPSSLSRSQALMRLHDRKQGVPYGVALGIAGLWLYSQSAVWAAFTRLT